MINNNILMQKGSKHIKYREYIGLFLVIMILALIPGIRFIPDRYNTLIDIGVAEEGIGYLIEDGKTYQQDIRLDGKLKSMQILFLHNSEKNNELGIVKCVIKQKNEIVEKDISVNQIGLWHYVEIELSNTKFKDGVVQLEIKSSDITQEDNTFIFVSPNTFYGVDNMTLEEQELEGPLIIKYSLRKWNNIMTYTVILAIVIIILSGIIAYYCTYKEENKSNTTITFVLTIALLMSIISFEYPLMSILAEPYVELGHEFYEYAKKMSGIQSFSRLEGGMYLSTLSRIIAILFVKVLGLKTSLFGVMQTIMMGIGTSFIAYICTYHFKKYFHISLRVIIAIVLGTLTFHSDSYTFIAVSYMGVIFIILFYLSDLVKMKKWEFTIGCIFSAILCISKMHYVILIPIAFIMMLYEVKEKRKRKSIYCLVIISAAMFQGVYSKFISPLFVPLNNMGNIADLSVGELLYKSFYYYVQIIDSYFGSIVNQPAIMGNILIVIGVIIIMSCMIICIIRKNSYYKEAIFIVCMNMLIFGNAMFSVLSNSIDANKTISWAENYYIYPFSHEFFAFVGLIGTIYGLIYIGKKFLVKELHGETKSRICKKYDYIVIVIIGFYSISNFSLYNNLFSNPTNSYCEWKTAYSITQSESSSLLLFAPYNDYRFINENAGVEEVCYNQDIAYNNIIDGVQINNINTIYVQKKPNLIYGKGFVEAYDSAGNLIKVLPQISSIDRLTICFFTEEPLDGVAELKFVYEDGTPMYISGKAFVGYKM